MLLPGLLCDETVWAAQRAMLSQADCVVPAYGGIDSVVGMARAVLGQVAAERFVLAGHSMGGRVALELTRLAPTRIERLALLDTGLDCVAPGTAGQEERRQRMELLALARERGMEAMARRWAPGMLHPRRVHGPLFEAVVAMVSRHTPDIYEAQINALLGRPDAHRVFAQLRCPTWLVCGRQDSWSPLSRHQEMQRELPSARLVVVEDAGHMSMLEQPAVVSRVLCQWLQHEV